MLETAFLATVACEPIEKKFREAVKSGALAPRSGVDTALLARDKEGHLRQIMESA